MPWSIRSNAVVLAALVAMIAGCAGRPNPIPNGAKPHYATAALVMANARLFREGSRDLPALVVFSLDPGVSFQDLRTLAKQVYSMRGSPPAEKDLKVLSRMVTDEAYRGDDFAKVPERLGYGREIYVAPVLVERERLSAGYLRPETALTLRVFLLGRSPYTTRLVSDLP
jgi:hypothetical protein